MVSALNVDDSVTTPLDAARPPRRRLRSVGLLAIAAVLAFLVTLLLVPVTFSTPTPPPADQATAWVRIPQPVESRVVIEQTEDAVTVVALELTRPEGFTQRLVESSVGWRYDAETQRWTATGPGRLVIEGVFADLAVVLVGETTAPGVTITRTGPAGRTPPEFLEAPSGPGFTRTVIASPGDRYESTKPLARALMRLDDLAHDDVSAHAAGVAVTPRQLSEHGVRSLLGASTVAVGSGVALFGVALLIMLFGWALGRSLDRSDRRGLTTTILRMTAGVMLLAILINSLAYLMATRWAALLAVVVALAVIATRGRSILRVGAAIDEFRMVTRAGVWLVPGLIIGFLPAFFWGARWVGNFNTDIYEYSTLASIARDHSLFAMQNLPLAQASGTLTSGAGISWRSIDSLAVAAASFLPGVNVVQGFAIVALVLFLLAGLAAVAIAAETGGGRWHRATVGLSLLAPLFLGLYIEGYYSHYFFIALVPLLVLGAWISVRQQEPGWLRLPEVATMATSAAMIAVYPYFAAVVFVALGGSLLVSPRGRAFLRRRGVIMTAGAIALTNFAFLTVLNYGDTTINQDSLNAIARGTLLAPFTNTQIAGLSAGVVPYQWHPADVQGHPWMGPLGSALWNLGEGARTMSPLFWGALVIIAAAGIAAATRWRATLRSFPALTWTLTVAFFAAMTLVLATSGHVYSALKAGWTAAALLPLITATLVIRPNRAVIGFVVMLPMALLWTRASVVDRTEYLIPRAAPVVQQESHSSVELDIALLRPAIDGASSVAVVEGPEPLGGSDKDRVAHAHTLVVLREMGIECVGCETEIASLAASPSCPTEPVQAVIVIGRTAQDQLCGRSLAARGDVIEVFR